MDFPLIIWMPILSVSFILFFFLITCWRMYKKKKDVDAFRTCQGQQDILSYRDLRNCHLPISERNPTSCDCRGYLPASSREQPHRVNNSYSNPVYTPPHEENPPPYTSRVCFDPPATLNIEPSAPALEHQHQMHIQNTNPTFFGKLYPSGNSAFSATTPHGEPHEPNTEYVSLDSNLPCRDNPPSDELTETAPATVEQNDSGLSSLTASGPSTILPPEQYAESSTLPSALSVRQQFSQTGSESTIPVSSPKFGKYEQSSELSNRNYDLSEIPLCKSPNCGIRL